MKHEKILQSLILVFIFIAFSVFAVSFTIFYTTENFSSACGCNLPIWVILISLFSLGLFTGLVMYFFLSSKFLKEKTKIEKNFVKIFDFLEEDDAKILKKLIEHKGELAQSKLTKLLGLSKVKLSRIISRMEAKGVIRKEKCGMTNKIIINKDLADLFENI